MSNILMMNMMSESNRFRFWLNQYVGSKQRVQSSKRSIENNPGMSRYELYGIVSISMNSIRWN